MNVDFFSKEELTEKYQEFRREVLLMSGLTHPNLVSLKKIAVKPFAMLTEYIPCGDLYKYLQRLNASSGGSVGGKDLLSWNMRIKIAESKYILSLDSSFILSFLPSFLPLIVSFGCFILDIATGMDFLHTTTPPVIHRDLKSPNVLVCLRPCYELLNRNTIR